MIVVVVATKGATTNVLEMSERVMVSTEFRTGPYFDPMFPDATYHLFRSTTEDDKYLPIISGWRVKKTELFLAKIS